MHPDVKIDPKSLPKPVAGHLRVSAWCRTCNRVLPRTKTGTCSYCLGPFDRSDRATFLREPRVDEPATVSEFVVPVVIAVLVYSSAWWLDGWVVRAVWASDTHWPMASMLIIWLRTVVVVAALLYPIRLTRWDHFLTYWVVGGIAGAVLALPFGLYAMMPGIVAGMGAAVWTRWFTISAFSDAGD